MTYSEILLDYISESIDKADTYKKLVDAGWLIEKYSGWALTEQDEEILRFNYSLAYNAKAERLYFQNN